MSRNPDFYTMEAVNRVTRHIGGRYQMGPGVTVPYDAERAVGIIGALEATPAIIEQASKALTEGVPEMADMAVEKLADVRQNYAEFARIVGPHLPEPHRSQVGPAAEKAGQALEEYRQWIRSNRDKMSAPYAIGRPAFEWYVQNVYVLPYDSEPAADAGGDGASEELGLSAVRATEEPPAASLWRHRHTAGATGEDQCRVQRVGRTPPTF